MAVQFFGQFLISRGEVDAVHIREALTLMESVNATLGDLAGLPRVAVADRFGGLGLRAHDLARGSDHPLRPRRPHEELLAALLAQRRLVQVSDDVLFLAETYDEIVERTIDRQRCQ